MRASEPVSRWPHKPESRVRLPSPPPSPALPSAGGCAWGVMPMAWDTSTRRSRLPKDWAKRVRAVRRRDRDTCYVCGGAECGNQRIEVDHVKRGDDHSLANLACIGADPCHKRKTAAEAAEARALNPSPSRRRPPEEHPGVLHRTHQDTA